jgi:hypothetical protein
MKKKAPVVALIWRYGGTDVARRRAEIEQFDYPDCRVVEAVQDVPPDAEICILWRDDDKPVTKRFISEMTNPLIVEDKFRAAMHVWSGNAISLPKKMLDDSGFKDGSNVYLLLKMLVPVVDKSRKEPGRRIHVAFSSTERLAPLALEPVGIPS